MEFAAVILYFLGIFLMMSFLKIGFGDEQYNTIFSILWPVLVVCALIMAILDQVKAKTGRK
jgi:uncharacterized membrane protein YqhA